MVPVVPQLLFSQIPDAFFVAHDRHHCLRLLPLLLSTQRDLVFAVHPQDVAVAVCKYFGRGASRQVL
jgi:hypothetical protein